MAKAKRPDPAKAIADAVKSKKDSDGMVKVYPTLPIGESRIPNVAAEVSDKGHPVPHTVTTAIAAEWLAYYPPAMTLFESGNPMPEQMEMHVQASEQAWGVSDPEDAPDMVTVTSPPFPEAGATAPDKE